MKQVLLIITMFTTILFSKDYTNYDFSAKELLITFNDNVTMDVVDNTLAERNLGIHLQLSVYYFLLE